MPSDILNQLQKVRKELWRRNQGDFSLTDWKEAISHFGLGNSVDVVETILSDGSPFPWRPLLGQYISDIFESERFPHLATKIEEKMPTYLWHEVTQASLLKPECAKGHVEALLPIKDEASARTVASLLAGIANSEAAWANKRTLLLLEGDKFELMASLRTIELCASNRTPSHNRLVDAVLSISIPQDTVLLGYYLYCLYPIHEMEPGAVENRMLRVLQIGPDWIKARVIQNASMLSDYSTYMRVQIAKEVLVQGRKELMDDIGMLLIEIYKEDRAYPLSAIRSIAENEHLSLSMGQFDRHLLSEVGKIDRSTAYHTMDSWFDDNPSNVLLFQMSDLLLGVFKEWPGELIDLTHHWAEGDRARFRTRIRILREMLSERVDNDGDPIVFRCAEEVIQIADCSQSRFTRAVEGETDIGYWALRILKEIISPWGKIDYHRVFGNLEKYSHIKDFLESQWLEQMRNQGADDLSILHMLDCEHCIHLAYWDDVFRFLDPGKPGIGKLRSDLRRYWRIQDTLSEAEVISRLIRRYPVDVKITIPGLNSEPDLRLHLTEQKPILEVYTPEAERKLQYAGGGGLDTERMKIKILDKFKKQFKAGAGSITDPVVFVIHAEGVSLQDYDMENILFGSLGMTLYFDKVEGKVVGKKIDRKSNSLLNKDTDTALISGFLVYQRDSRKDADKALRVEYYSNPAAWHPLTQTSIVELCSALSLDWTEHRHR